MNQRILVTLAFASVSVAIACPYYTTLRSYLDARFWAPLPKRIEVQPSRLSSQPFAGMSWDESAPESLKRVRMLHDGFSYANSYVRQKRPVGTPTPQTPSERDAIVAAALADPLLTERQRDEVRLIDAKTGVSGEVRGPPEALTRAEQKLTALIRSTKDRAYRSEAQGWLARVYYLTGREAEAAKIYLDEIQGRQTNISLTALKNSLDMVSVDRSRLTRDLEQYFDAPHHALFAIEQITKPPLHNRVEFDVPEFRLDDLQRLVSRRETLFQSGAASEALTVALMRVALFKGQPAMAIQFASRLGDQSKLRSGTEFNWLLGSSLFLSRRYDDAEAPLRRMYSAKSTTVTERAAASQGLIGVYMMTGRPTDALRFALLYDSEETDGEFASTRFWPYLGRSFDLRLMLDAQLRDEDLTTYLQKYADSVMGKRWDRRDRRRLVGYALAVRLARQERFDESATWYEATGNRLRAARMKEVGRLYSRTQEANQAPAERAEARFAYASFLADNPERIFFNDALWGGFQTTAFSRHAGLPRRERDEILAIERKLQDDQEERWRAALIFEQLAEEATDVDFQRRAIRRALDALARIHGRFGRFEEIEAKSANLQRKLRALNREQEPE